MSQAVAVVDVEEELQTQYCIDLDTRDRQVEENSRRIAARLEDHPAERPDRVAVVCFGPSLVDTWEELRGYRYIITCSGAHRFLIERGIIPTWHVAVDPRVHQVALLDTPHPDVEYLFASVVHPSLLDHMEKHGLLHKVKLWHVHSHEARRKGVIQIAARGEWALTGGLNAGMRSIVIARFLGFRGIDVFAMDSSFREDGTQHAGWHCDETKRIHAVEVGGRTYFTSGPMHHYAQRFIKEINKVGQVDVKVKGEGLLQAIVREHEAKGLPLIAEKSAPDRIAAIAPFVISPDYAEQNRLLHDSNPLYGTSGVKYADAVERIIAAIKPDTVLDYGCGKGTLAKALSRPIWEYDPAIPGKDAVPRPADLVVCTDVLEHVEPDFLDSVLLDLQRVTLKVCYLVIHTGAAGKTLPDGRNAHLIQQDANWWRERVARFFHVESIEEAGPECRMVVGPHGSAAVKAPGIAAPAEKPKAKPKQAVLDVANRTTPFRHDGTEVVFHTPNDITLWRAQTLATKEPATLAWIDSMRAGDLMYDIGANVGGYTVWAAKRRGVRVVAFEPQAENYALLCRNIALNKSDATAYCVAISDFSRLDRLHLTQADAGGSCNSFGAAVDPSLKPRKGAAQGAVGFTLDDVASQIGQPRHIKIDVDGLEHLVIAGGYETLSRARSVLLEVNTNLPEHMEMLAKLQALGYEFDQAQVDASMRKEGAFKGCAEYVLRRKIEASPWEAALLEKIRSAPMRTDPFPHLYIEDVFDENTYAATQAAIVPGGYQTLKDARGTDGYPERFVKETPHSMQWLTDGALRDALDERFGTVSRKEESCLLLDRPGYAIGPHTDTPSKAVTALFYLNDTGHGTSLYKPLISSFECKEGRHHEREGFREVWRAPGKANSVLIFARTDKSFHGCEPYDGLQDRHILLYDTKR